MFVSTAGLLQWGGHHEEVWALQHSPFVGSVHTGRAHLRYHGVSAAWWASSCDWWLSLLPPPHRLVGLVVKASALRAEDQVFESCLQQDFSGLSHTSDLEIGTPVATLQGVWCYRISTGTGRPGVSVLWLGEVESLIWSFYLSVVACKIVWAYPSLRYTRMLLER